MNRYTASLFLKTYGDGITFKELAQYHCLLRTTKSTSICIDLLKHIFTLDNRQI